MAGSRLTPSDQPSGGPARPEEVLSPEASRRVEGPSRRIEWRYIGHQASPDRILLNRTLVAKGGTVWLPEDYDFTREYGGNVKLGLRLERVSPPLDDLTPLRDGADAPPQGRLRDASGRRSSTQAKVVDRGV